MSLWARSSQSETPLQPVTVPTTSSPSDLREDRVEIADLVKGRTGHDAIGLDHQRSAGHAGRLGEPANRAHEPAQHPHGAGAARSDAVMVRKTLPVHAGRVIPNGRRRGKRLAAPLRLKRDPGIGGRVHR
jgi:hypothetical protein